VVGSWLVVPHSKTEMFLFDSEKWIEKDTYPFHYSISHYAALPIKRAVYIIGGYDSSGFDIATVAIFENEKWRKAGELNQNRRGHGAITVNEKIYVIGGWGSQLITEIWDLTSNNSISVGTALDDYAWFPYLFVVHPDQCSSCSKNCENGECVMIEENEECRCKNGFKNKNGNSLLPCE